MEDTASSIALRVSSPSALRARTPNVTFARGVAARSRSASPRPRRSVSPLGVSVAQRRAQLAAQSAATAVSGVGHVEAETRRVRALVDASTAEARSVRSEVETRLASLATAAETSTARVAAELGEQVRSVAEYADAQTSRTAAELSQRLGTEIKAAATSAAATAEEKTRTMISGVRWDLQAKLNANHAESLGRYEETQRSIQSITEQLQSLSDQLKNFNPASVSGVEQFTGQIEKRVQQKIDEQQKNIQSLTNAVLEGKKESQSNAATLETLLVGIENLGDNMKKMQEEMLRWQDDVNEAEQGYERMEEELLKEIPIPNQPEMPQTSNPPTVPINPLQVPVTSPLQPIPEGSVVQAQSITPCEMDRNIQIRWSKLMEMQTPVKPSTLSSVPIGGTSQATNPQFFEMGSNLKVPQTLENQETRQELPIPLNVTLPMISAPMNVETTPRRITPIPVIPQGEVHSTNKGTSGMSGVTMDLHSETTATSHNTPGPTIGSTTIDTTEEQRIHTIVCRVMEEQFGVGRAALRKQLGFAHNDVTSTQRMSTPPMKASVAPNVLTGKEVPHTSFGSPLSIDGVSPSMPSVSTGTQPFATAAWKPKEPPCFFGRSTEDAHTWVSLVRNYLTFMSGSDSQQVAYTVTLFRDAAHEWYISYERRNRGPPRDWAGLVAALLDRFGSNIRSQEAQSQLMSISQGSRAVRDYASQFETLLGRLDSYDEGLMLNQFIWGLQPDLARSVSLHYPNTIAKAVTLAETTELAAKASRRPGTRTNTSNNPAKGPNQQNRGQGQWRWRGGNRGGRRGGSSGGSARGNTRGRGGYGRGRSYSANFDPLACFRCGVRGHLARDCPQAAPSQGSVNAGPSRGTFSRSGQPGPKNRGRGRRVRFGGLNVLYDEDGTAYPVDDAGQLYVPLDCGQDADGMVQIEEEKDKSIKN